MIRNPQSTRRLRLESLETRTLLSVTVLEFEPNDDPLTSANLIPLQRDSAGQADALLKGSIDAPGDRDSYQMTLKAGDVIGATVQGQGKLDPVVRFLDAEGELLFYNDYHRQVGSAIPQESPLPTISSNDPESVVYYVVCSPGTYYLQIGGSGDTSVGTYRTDVVVARPGMEAESVGTRQLVYVDFNGADVNTSIYGAHGTKSLTPLSGFLDRWGLTPADEDAVISRAMEVVEKTLSQQIRIHGLNGDFDKSGEPGEFAIDILNSRDNPEFDSQFGTHPYLSRVVVGGTLQQVDLGRPFYGIAQHVDPGNFSFDDDAVVLLDALSRAPDEVNDPDGASLNWVEIDPKSTKADLVGTAVGLFVAHETAHNFGAFHTTPPGAHSNVMNLGGPGGFPFLGPDRIFGTKDDIDVRFGVDSYGNLPFIPPDGEPTVNDTLNTLAFGLSTGTRDAAMDAAVLWFVHLDGSNQDQQQTEPPSRELVDLAMFEMT